jgi:catechol 2,3-dioxygenase-like lactoylglutathione lyase family enzyme
MAEKPIWVPAPEYGRSLKGFSLNLLVSDLKEALRFQTEVLAATVVYQDDNFAVLQGQGGEWMLHDDHTYESHPLLGLLGPEVQRGAGAELRLHGRDPDQAVMLAQKLGYHVLAPAKDKPHGLREAYILDNDGYIWVPDIQLDPWNHEI